MALLAVMLLWPAGAPVLRAQAIPSAPIPAEMLEESQPAATPAPAPPRPAVSPAPMASPLPRARPPAGAAGSPETSPAAATATAVDLDDHDRALAQRLFAAAGTGMPAAPVREPEPPSAADATPRLPREQADVIGRLVRRRLMADTPAGAAQATAIATATLGPASFGGARCGTSARGTAESACAGGAHGGVTPRKGGADPGAVPAAGHRIDARLGAPSAPSVAASAFSADATQAPGETRPDAAAGSKGVLAAAERLRRHERLKAALRLADSEVGLHPRSTDARWLRARIEADMGRPRSALHDALAAVKESRGDIDALVRFAQLAQDLGATDVAERAFRAAERLSARAAAAEGTARERRARAQARRDTSARLGRAVRPDGSDRQGGATRSDTAAPPGRPAPSDGEVPLGSATRRDTSPRPDGSGLPGVSPVVQAEPGVVIRAHARAQMARGDTSAAVLSLRRLVRRERGVAANWLELGRALFRDGDLIESRNAMARALALARDDRAVRIAAAEGLAWTGAVRPAVRALDREVQGAGHDVAPRLALARVLAAAGYFNRARHVLVIASRLAPRDADVWAARCDLSRARGHERAAWTELRRALALDPDNSFALAARRALERTEGRQVPLLGVEGLHYRGYSRYTSVPVAPAVAAADAQFQGATAAATAGLLVPPVTEAEGVTEVSLAPGLLPRTRLRLEGQRREHTLVLTSATPQDVVRGETSVSMVGTSPEFLHSEMRTSIGLVSRAVSGFRPGDPEREDVNALDLGLGFTPCDDGLSLEGHLQSGQGHFLNVALDTDVTRVDLALVRRFLADGLTVKYRYDDDQERARGLPSRLRDLRVGVDASWDFLPGRLFEGSLEERLVSHDDPAGALSPTNTGRSLGVQGRYERPLGAHTRLGLGASYTWDQSLNLTNLATWTMDVRREVHFLPGQPLLTLGLGRALYTEMDRTYFTLDLGLGSRF